MRFIGILCLFSIGVVHSAEISEPIKKSIRDRVSKKVNPSIVMAVIDEDGIDYFGHGVTRSSGPPVNEHTIYEIGSITKTFTGLLLAQMAKEGKVGLNDPIQQYLPKGIHAPTRSGQQIRLIHLATHRSSLPPMPGNFKPVNRSNPFADYDEDKLYEFLDSYELPRDIGSQWVYSNLGMGLLGNLLARATADDFDALLEKQILNQLGMHHTWTDKEPDHDTQRATGHKNGKPVANWDLNSLVAAGGVKSTAADLARYVSAQMGIRKTSLYKAMKQTQANTADPEIGMGWMFHGSQIIHHGGATGGYRAFVGFKRDGSKGVVVLTNSLGTIDDLGFNALDENMPLDPVLQSLERVLSETLAEEGVAMAIAKYLRLKVNQIEDYDFGPAVLNNIGYQLLDQGRNADAIAIFELNVSEYPKESNTHDSLAEAHLKAGSKELAIKHYRDALALDPGNSKIVAALTSLGAPPDRKDLSLSREILLQYSGRYQLAEHFFLTITVEGTQLMVQPTGQSKSPVFASDVDQFYFKNVNARITFHRNATNKVERLTLHQNGNHSARRLTD